MERYIATSYKELQYIASVMANAYIGANQRLVYRGQIREYPTIQSTLLRTGGDPWLQHKWFRALDYFTLLPLNTTQFGETLTKLTDSEKWALFQHYGYISNLVDVTYSLDKALWFALHEFKSESHIFKYVMDRDVPPPNWYTGEHVFVEYVSECFPSDQATAIIYVLKTEIRQVNSEGLKNGNSIDLQTIVPTNSSRMNAQSALGMLSDQNLEGDTNVHSYAVAEIEIRFAYEAIPKAKRYEFKDLFPSPESDPIYQYFLSLPFEQLQPGMFLYGRVCPIPLFMRSNNSKKLPHSWLKVVLDTLHVLPHGFPYFDHLLLLLHDGDPLPAISCNHHRYDYSRLIPYHLGTSIDDVNHFFNENEPEILANLKDTLLPLLIEFSVEELITPQMRRMFSSQNPHLPSAIWGIFRNGHLSVRLLYSGKFDGTQGFGFSPIYEFIVDKRKNAVGVLGAYHSNGLQLPIDRLETNLMIEALFIWAKVVLLLQQEVLVINDLITEKWKEPPEIFISTTIDMSPIEFVKVWLSMPRYRYVDFVDRAKLHERRKVFPPSIRLQPP